MRKKLKSLVWPSICVGLGIVLVGLFQNCESNTPNLQAGSRETASSSSLGTSPVVPTSPSGDYALKSDLASYVRKIGDAISGNLTITGNVGIKTTNPEVALHVVGITRTDRLEANSIESRPAYAAVRLDHCGTASSVDPCPGNHPVGQWFNLMGAGMRFVPVMNTNDSVLQVGINGKITVLKAGVYEIRMSAMIIPLNDTNHAINVCPFINGSANCGPMDASASIRFGYMRAAEYSQLGGPFVFVMDLPANTVIEYGYYPVVDLTTWGHDHYTAMEVRRLN